MTVVALLFLAPQARAQDEGLPIGSTAPKATLNTLDGKTVDLAQIAKGPALIEFWAAWCENCEKLLPTIQKAHAAYGSKVNFVGVAVSASESLKRVQLHVAKYKLPGVQLYDTKGTASGAWDVPATSYVVILDKSGKVVYTGVGGDQKLDAALKKVI